MDLKSGFPFWSLRNGLMCELPPLRRDVVADVVIVGGGITGALVAHELASHGHAVAVLEQRDLGWGSTAASTALLQYEIDTHMTELARRYGEDDAWLAYGHCAQAIELLAQLATQVGDVDFSRNASLYYASHARDVDGMQAEFALRRKHGLAVEWLTAGALGERYGMARAAAILSAQAARVDPYRLAWRVFMGLADAGAAIHDRTTVARIEVGRRGMRVHTAAGAVVSAAHLVLAAGYANQGWLDTRVARNYSSYALITDPLLPGQLGFLQDTLLWESARPYLYARTTGSGRLLLGGEDDAVDIPARRDARVGKKVAALRRKFARLMPQVPTEPAFSWGGTFAETADGLPFFGPHPQHGPRVLFAMAYGGNGISYSMLGAGLLRAMIERRRHRLDRLFTFDRLQRM